MVFSVSELPSLAGKTVIVTGANTGLGLESAKQLAAKGATVVLACRDVAKGRVALAAVEAVKADGGSVELEQLDLGDLASIKGFADRFNASERPLHVLLNNAGIMHTPFGKTSFGVEQQFGVNHCGHFSLTAQLMGALKRSQPSRVVNLSSSLHQDCPADGMLLDDHNWERHTYTIQAGYGHAKAANILFSQELARRLEGTDVRVNSVHPGFVKTELTRHRETSWFMRQAVAFVKWRSALSVEDGALTQLYVAASPDIETGDVRSKFFVPIAQQAPLKGALAAMTPAVMLEQQKGLWTLSEKLVGHSFDL